MTSNHAYHYTDPRGKQCGPFTEAELVNIARRGLIERDGIIHLEGAPTHWRADEIGWLLAALNGVLKNSDRRSANRVLTWPTELLPAGKIGWNCAHGYGSKESSQVPCHNRH